MVHDCGAGPTTGSVRLRPRRGPSARRAGDLSRARRAAARPTLPDEMAAPVKTALVLGAGGIAGGAWLLGALSAIEAETGWRPASADRVVGTSAGSLIGALLASGVAPDLMVAYARGEDIESPLLTERERGGTGARDFGAKLQLHWSFPRPVLGSPELALRSLREPWRYGPAGIIAWLPRGLISTEPIREVVERVVPSGWTRHPHFWIVAIDYESGEKVVFGRDGAPPASLAEAVAASCAVPGFYHPVGIGGRRYVDGGVYSPSNLDVLLGTDVQLVLCLNPMTSRHRGGAFEPTGPIASLVRGSGRRQLEREAGALRLAGKRVLLLEPRAEDVNAMGYNYMSGRRRDRILTTAIRTTTTALRTTELGRTLSALVHGGNGNRGRFSAAG